ncbi:putative integral membrane zinc-ribbon metal-binding protein [Sarocladium implicatum]|nr:putative integral membrane zinc-ribbon metal-binding protein [Sarocladium implicatum]
MVSWLPWRGDSSTATFEKTLSALSVKITTNQARLDKLRASSRRVRVLATLYLSFAYLVYAIVAFLVIGTNELGRLEWAGVVGGPLIVFGVRKTLGAYYNFRIDSLSAKLKDQQTERANTIQKLKDATKYDSTLELIEKYGGADGKPKSKSKDGDDAADDAGRGKKQRHSNVGPMPGRTMMPPPPTANIQRRVSSTPGSPPPMSPQGPAHDPMEPTAEFAPNAGAGPVDQRHSGPPYPDTAFPTMPPAPESGHWYDRIFDVLLGEDEAAPKNRIVLICQACRIVNGQAPPGTRSLTELGLWRCMSCGASNGVEREDEGKRIVREVLQDSPATAEPIGTDDKTSEDEAAEPEMQSIDDTPDDGPAAAVRKRRTKGKK